LTVFACTDDITTFKVGAIVNAANSFLENHGGIARAIEDVGGVEFGRRCRLFIQENGPLKVCIMFYIYLILYFI